MDDLFSPLFESVVSSAQAIPHAMAEWMRVMTMRGSLTIARRMAVGDGCELDGCATRQVAGIKCFRCGKCVCLHHAYISPTGDGICVGCSGTKAPPRPVDAPEVQAAFAFLGLDSSATREQVDKRVKELRRKHHPDRVQDAVGKRRAEDASRAIGSAHQVIRKARKWA